MINGSNSACQGGGKSGQSFPDVSAGMGEGGKITCLVPTAAIKFTDKSPVTHRIPVLGVPLLEYKIKEF